MEMMNRAIEDASAFTDLKRRLLAQDSGFSKAMREEIAEGDANVAPEVQDTARGANENRAQHRARLKRERREAKRTKAAA